MTKQEQYKLKFEKINTPIKRVMCTCRQMQVTNDSIYLCRLLDDISDKSPQYLLNEINNALINGSYEEYFEPDGSLESVRINPPNAIVNENYKITLTDLRELLIEWITFCDS